MQNLLPSQANLAAINGDAEPRSDPRRSQAMVDLPVTDEDRVKIIAATKAIGHGFDVARLGVMAVMGTPTSAAEIIQASARAGRRWPGLVVYIVNPTRDAGRVGLPVLLLMDQLPGPAGEQGSGQPGVTAHP